MGDGKPVVAAVVRGLCDRVSRWLESAKEEEPAAAAPTHKAAGETNPGAVLAEHPEWLREVWRQFDAVRFGFNQCDPEDRVKGELAALDVVCQMLTPIILKARDEAEVVSGISVSNRTITLSDGEPPWSPFVMFEDAGDAGVRISMSMSAFWPGALGTGRKQTTGWFTFPWKSVSALHGALGALLQQRLKQGV